MATKTTRGKPRRMRGRAVTVTQGTRAPLCIAQNAGGAPCGRSTTHPSGLCPTHRQKSSGGPGLADTAQSYELVPTAAPLAVPPPDPLATKVLPGEVVVVADVLRSLAIPTPTDLVLGRDAADEMIAGLAAAGIDVSKMDPLQLASNADTANDVANNVWAASTLAAYTACVAEVDRALVEALGCTRDKLWPMDGNVLWFYLTDVVARAKRGTDADAPAPPIPETPCIVEVGEIDPATGKRRPCGKPTTHPSKWCSRHGAPPCTAEVGEIDPTTRQRRGCKRRTDHPSALCLSHRQRLAGKVAPGTLEIQVSAVGFVHRQKYPASDDPSHHPKVRNFLRGYRNDYEDAAKGNGKAPPLLGHHMTAISERMGHKKLTPDEPMFMNLTPQEQARYCLDERDAALVEMAGVEGLSARKLAALEWSQVTFLEDGAELHLTDGRRPGWVQVVALDEHQDEALRRLRYRTAPGDNGRVFRRGADGEGFVAEGLSDVRVGQIVSEALDNAGVHLADDAAISTLAPEVRHAAARRILAPPDGTFTAKDLRDRAMLNLGWWRAARRSNIVALDWGDITVVPPNADGTGGGVEVFHRKSKTDQEARGSLGKRCPAVRLENGDPHPVDPVSSIGAWRDEWTRLMGRSPRPDDPVYVQLVGSGTAVPTDDNGNPIAKRIGKQAVNRVVADRAAAAGLGEGWTAHSLRRGQATSIAAGTNATVEHVAEVTEHASLDQARAYIDDQNRTSAGHDLVIEALLAERAATG